MQTPHRLGVWSALGTIYLIWGSTYLAIRVAVDTLPPFLMASVRFLVAGGILYGLTALRGSPRPTLRQWRATAVVGGALILGGNGGVVWAEQTVPSGLAALVIAIVPLFMVLLDRVFLGRGIAPVAWVGVLAGLAGVALLIGPSDSGGVDWLGAAVLVGAALSWSAGSVYATRTDLPPDTLRVTGMEMLAGGALLGVAGLAAGELGRAHPEEFSSSSLLALGYLIVFGSLVAFSAYVFLLRVERTSVVATYAYVNPAVAVLLGWLILSEPVTLRTLLSGVIIIGSVALIITARSLVEPIGGSPGGDRGTGRKGRLVPPHEREQD